MPGSATPHRPAHIPPYLPVPTSPRRGAHCAPQNAHSTHKNTAPRHSLPTTPARTNEPATPQDTPQDAPDHPPATPPKQDCAASDPPAYNPSGNTPDPVPENVPSL